MRYYYYEAAALPRWRRPGASLRSLDERAAPGKLAASGTLRLL